MIESDFLPRLYDLFRNSEGVSIDTRTLNAGEIFFALSGPNFNGNEYASKALALGALLVVVDDEEVYLDDDDRYILVSNSLEALQALGSHHRLQSKAQVIGITGSNGKTTTKELMACALAATYKIIYTQGNLNNHIGVPLTLLTIKDETEIAVVEMGANHIGEIAELCEIAKPDFGIITNIGRAHLEGFGSLEGVKRGKGELFEYIKSSGGELFVNTDENYLFKMSEGYDDVHLYSETSNFQDNIPISFKIGSESISLSFEWNQHYIEQGLQIYGRYNIPNILAALNIAFHFGIEPRTAVEAIAQYIPSNKRSQKIITEKNEIYLDAYNANPSSMEHALRAFSTTHGQSKLAILGDMFELGKEAQTFHELIAKLADELIDEIILVGENFAKTTSSAPQFETTDQLRAYLQKHPIEGKSILLKGSRSMALERLVDFL